MPPPPEPIPAASQRVLLVDDDRDVHDLVRVWLMEEAVELHDCFDGAACLRLARAEPAPDLIPLRGDPPRPRRFCRPPPPKARPREVWVPGDFPAGRFAPPQKTPGPR